MPHTPSNRTTRSGSNASNITLSDIKTLIENSKSEILLGVKTEVERLTTTIHSLINRVEALETKNTELEERCKQIEEKSDNGLTTGFVAESLCKEVLLRKRKEKYLVINGMPEATSGSVAERKQSDEENIKLIAASLDVRNISVSDVSRLGRSVGVLPRLVRFKCSDRNIKAELLRKAKELRTNPNYSRIFISPDLTKIQLSEAKILQNELKRRREAGERVVIFRGSIVSKERVYSSKENFRI